MCIDAQFFVQRCTFLSAKGGKGIKDQGVGSRSKDQGVRGKDKGERA